MITGFTQKEYNGIFIMRVVAMKIVKKYYYGSDGRKMLLYWLADA